MTDEDAVEDELRELRGILTDYVQSSLDQHKKRRTESIQVLVALGIVGAYFTSAFQNFLSHTTFKLPVFIVLLSSLGFLFLKVVIPPLRVSKENGKLKWLDQIGVHFLYMLSIVLGAIFSIVIMLPKLSIPEAPISSWLFTALITVIAGGISIYLTKKRREVLEHEYERERRIDNSMARYTEDDIKTDLIRSPEIFEGKLSGVKRASRSIGVDFIGRVIDSENEERALIEIKTTEITKEVVERVVEAMKRYEGFKCRAYIVGPEISEEAREEIESKNIKFIRFNHDEAGNRTYSWEEI